MKKLIAILIVTFVATSGVFAATKLLSVDEAIANAAAEIEAKIAAGSEIAVYKIVSTDNVIGDWLCEELIQQFNGSGRLKTLARDKALTYVDQEQQFQMSGLVTDATVVGVGHYIGAKVVISGTFDRYDGFDQLRLRAVDVRTSELTTAYGVRTDSKDKVLASITKAPKQKAAKITDTVLDILNKGRDLLAEGKLDEAIVEFDHVVALNKKFVDVYFYRGLAYEYKGDLDNAIANYNQAIKLDRKLFEPYLNRGIMYWNKGDYDRAMADFSHAIKLAPIDALAYKNRGVAYSYKGDLDKAIADYNQAIKFKPDYAEAYSSRGVAYAKKGDSDKAIKDFNEAIRIDPNYAVAYYNRGCSYSEKEDYDRAIADYSQAIRIDPNYASAYLNRGVDYLFGKGNNERAIADFESALRIDPDFDKAKRALDYARQKRGQ